MGLSNQYAYPCCAATRQDSIYGYGAAVMSVTREESEKYGLDGIFQKQSAWWGFCLVRDAVEANATAGLSDDLGCETW